MQIDTQRMQIPENLQPRALLVDPAALAKHLQSIVLSDHSQETLSSINACILHQVHTEAIPPLVYRVWLFIACQYSSQFFLPALRDQKFPDVRLAGIKALLHISRKVSWKERVWEPLGGAQGLKAVIDGLPLAEVRWFVKAISPRPGNESFAACIDDLVALIDSSDTWKTRSLSKQVAPLLARCSSKKVTEFLRSEDAHDVSQSSYFYRDLGQYHPDLLRQIAVGTVEVPSSVRLDILRDCATALLQSKEAYVPVHATDIQPDISPGVKFGLDLLSYIKATGPDTRTNKALIPQWPELVVNQAIRCGLPFDYILPIINSSLEMCRVANSSNWLSQHLTVEVILCWSQARFGGSSYEGSFSFILRNAQASSPTLPSAANRDALERCLIEQVLQTKDERLSVQRTRSEFTRMLSRLLSYVHIDGKLDLLQLLCRHAPTLNFDLTLWPPSEEERKLTPIWEYDTLRYLPVSSSKSLFQRLLHIHNCDTHLPSDLLKRNSWQLSWENQCSLWAQWERSNAKTSDDFPVTLKAITEMKERATRDRDGSERLRWAKSAIKLASETKSVVIFDDLVKWSQRFLRDQQMFPDILHLIHSEASSVLSCGADTRVVKPVSKLNLRADVEKANLNLKGQLETLLLLLREPWARSKRTMSRMTSMVYTMFSSIVKLRMDAVRYYLSIELAPESEMVEILLDSLLPILIDYEREGNIEDQEVFSWSGPEGRIGNIHCPSNPSKVDLSFMDRLGKLRDELWKDLRTGQEPGNSSLEPSWPRGLPIQNLVMDRNWLYHALERPEEAPFLSSRTREILFSPRDIAISTQPKASKFVDDLGFAIRATMLSGADKIKWITLVWKHYSSILQNHPLYLEIFQDWLVGLLQDYRAVEAIDIVRPPSPPPLISSISKVPTGSKATNWNPHQYAKDVEAEVPLLDDQRPREIPRILLNYRMNLPIQPGDDLFVRTREIKPRPTPGPIGFWLESSPFIYRSKENCVDRREAGILSALLILNHFTSQPRLLRTGFPEAGGSRYGPTCLSEEFVTRVIEPKDSKPIEKALGVLERAGHHVPASLLRDLIYSFLDTLKASPNAPSYPKILHCTFELIKLLLRGSQPQLVTEVALRVWKDFPNDSSSHRKVSPVKIGRILPPGQADDLMQSFVEYACDTLQKNRELGDSPEKPFVKITTIKMLAQALAQADFLAPSTQIHLLERLCGASNHVDVRVEIVQSVFQHIRSSKNPGAFGALSTIALSSAAGPSERDIVTEDSWRAAEAGGSLPLVLSDRPILDLIVSQASMYIPKELYLDYVQNVVLPLVTESIRQHTRWMTILLSRIGLSLSDLALASSDIGPFSSDLVDTVFRKWARYLPATYLQYHRSWGLVYLHRDSFNRVSEVLLSSTDPIKEDSNVRDHLQALLKSQHDRSPFSIAYHFSFLVDGDAPNGITSDLFLDEFRSRVGIFSKSPVAYNLSLNRYGLHPGYLLSILRGLRKARHDLGLHLPLRYAYFTKLMMIIVDAAEEVRKEGWSPELGTHPASVSTPFEYEIEMLPSPSWSPPPSTSALNEFVSVITCLISKYAADPVLLMKLDCFEPILKEVSQDQRETCALLLGEDLDDGSDRDRLVNALVRVKLAVLLLEYAPKEKVPLNERTLGMIERWKGSEIEMVRQTGWAWDWKNSKPTSSSYRNPLLYGL